MGDDWTKKVINDWIDHDMLSKDAILGRLDRRIQGSYAIREEEKKALEEVFQSVCNEKGYLTEAAFISLLQAKPGLPQSPGGTDAGKILYACLVHLSTLPFPCRPDDSATQTAEDLSLAQLTRSLVWILPDRYGYIIEEGSASRMRTKADHRRLLFQSLASSTHAAPIDPERARELALGNAFDIDREDLREFCSTNHDDDGDEIYHDLLDILYSTQEVKNPCIASVPRDAFRPIAKRIAATNEVTSLHSLAIPAESFVALVRVLAGLAVHQRD